MPPTHKALVGLRAGQCLIAYLLGHYDKERDDKDRALGVLKVKRLPERVRGRVRRALNVQKEIYQKNELKDLYDVYHAVTPGHKCEHLVKVRHKIRLIRNRQR